MKHGRTRDGKDVAARASALLSSEMSGWLPPLSALPLPGGDRDVGEPGAFDCPAVLQSRSQQHYQNDSV